MVRYLSLLVCFLGLVLNVGCSTDDDASKVLGSTTATTGTDSQVTAAVAANQAAVTNQVANVTTDAALANVSDFSTLGVVAVPALRFAVTVPSLPTQPPQMPSGNPVLATSTVLGTAPNTATVNWYVYLSSLDLTSAWAEWKTTIVKSTATLFTSYWQMSAPVAKTDTSTTRGFSASGWNGSSLVIYTIGTGTYQSSGAVAASGTQVANVLVAGTPTQVAYGFTAQRASDGSVSGSLAFNGGGSVIFSRTAPNTAAIGTIGTYTQTTGTINATVPAVRTLNFTSTVYGNNTMKVIVTTSTITTALTYAADGSGSGNVTGVLGRSIALTCDLTGAATATIAVGPLTKTVSTTVVPRPVDEVPGA